MFETWMLAVLALMNRWSATSGSAHEHAYLHGQPDQRHARASGKTRRGRAVARQRHGRAPRHVGTRARVLPSDPHEEGPWLSPLRIPTMHPQTPSALVGSGTC